MCHLGYQFDNIPIYTAHPLTAHKMKNNKDTEKEKAKDNACNAYALNMHVCI